MMILCVVLPVNLRGRQEAAANREIELERKRKEREEVLRLKARQRAEVANQ